jgi:hypothetical protein
MLTSSDDHRAQFDEVMRILDLVQLTAKHWRSRPGQLEAGRRRHHRRLGVGRGGTQALSGLRAPKACLCHTRSRANDTCESGSLARALSLARPPPQGRGRALAELFLILTEKRPIWVKPWASTCVTPSSAAA